jgi:hypothetical protein
LVSLAYVHLFAEGPLQEKFCLLAECIEDAHKLLMDEMIIKSASFGDKRKGHLIDPNRQKAYEQYSYYACNCIFCELTTLCVEIMLEIV